ncbi:ABC transporter ATP-binding protein [Aureivirga marina]|uniref:ABC transporter ATP-binding protein n=1 Tax=Aureivirga marina TaxID=1182451 RepID=UPI0018CBA135|nr:ABC transporter ATP-binding protein [Aureivirga marina]
MKDIVVNNISYKIHGKQILHDISFEINEKESFALLGENGAGKSTLIDIILDNLSPSNGTVHFFEQEQKDFKNIGIIHDHLPLFALLKTWEVVDYFCSIYGTSFQKVKEKYFDILDIHKIKDSFIKELSQGEKKRVSVLLTVMHDPKVIIMDEPFANLDPTVIDKIWTIVKGQNRTLFFSTHNWKDAEFFADKIAFIHNGRIVMEPNSPKNYLEMLPQQQKIIVEYAEDLEQSLKDIPYYIHDKHIYIFYDKQESLMKTINSFTNNYSITKVDLKDVFLYFTKSNNHV